MNKKQFLLAGLIMAAMSDTTYAQGPKKTREGDIDMSPRKAPIPPGMKEWDIDGVTVIAATKKAAKKKADKKRKQLYGIN